MNIWQIIGIIAASVGIFFGGLGYFAKGKSDAKKDVIEISQKTIDLLNDQIKGLQELAEKNAVDIRNLSDKVIELQTSLREKEQKISEYVSILQGRDPEIKTSLIQLHKIAENSVKTLETSNRTLSKMEKAMEAVVPTLQSVDARITKVEGTIEVKPS